jgi:hypothetical protein
MVIPPEALDLENRSIGSNGQPTLAGAHVLLVAQWRKGDRDRELGLHLMFTAWYLLFEPPCLTGLDAARVRSEDLAVLFSEVHDYFKPTIASDAEMLYAVGLMAHLFPWVLGDESTWEAVARDYRVRYRQLAPQGLSPEMFSGRGAYGDYFGGQSTVRNGY